MSLIDGDCFEGRFRYGMHIADVSDLMRRMVKGKLLKFDGTPLFPERIAYTVPYKLSAGETDSIRKLLITCASSAHRLLVGAGLYQSLVAQGIQNEALFESYVIALGQRQT